MKPLGQKIKFFRKRAKISQFELEGKIGASAGSLSRIESGEVNPTKETLEKIKKALNLTYIETLFLDGDYIELLDKEEAQKAANSVAGFLDNPKVFAYIIDERFRLWGVSDGFKKALNLQNEPIIGDGSRNVLEMFFSEKSIIAKNFNPESKYKAALYQLARAMQILSLFEIDEYIFSIYSKLSISPLFKKIWKEVNQKNYDTYLMEARTIVFNFRNKNFVMEYQREPLQSNPRLTIVVYKPTSLLLKFLSKF